MGELLCAIARTHRLGEKCSDYDPVPSVAGPVTTYRHMSQTLNRSVMAMVLAQGHQEEVPPRSRVRLPTLFEPQLVTFDSRRGMLVHGFEEIDSRKYFQGWLIQWEMPKSCITETVRTHEMGTRQGSVDTAAAVAGPVSMHSVGGQAGQRVDTLMAVINQAMFGRINKSPIPDLFEPTLLAFDSRKGMMVCGFENIGRKRYYQGWWIRWPLASTPSRQELLFTEFASV